MSDTEAKRQKMAERLSRVEAQMKNLADPLEAEFQTTTSWWVKIRNRLYITLMQQAVKAIAADVKQKIA